MRPLGAVSLLVAAGILTGSTIAFVLALRGIDKDIASIVRQMDALAVDIEDLNRKLKEQMP